MSLRPPSVDPGVQSFLWGLALGVYVWLGLRAVGVTPATSFIFAGLAGFGIFLFVRLLGEERPRRPSRFR
jgi:hypothetical protein